MSYRFVTALFALLAGVPSFALTLQQEEAKHIFNNLQKILSQTQTQKDHFSVWTRDTSAMTAMECLQRRLIPESSGIDSSDEKKAHIIIENFLKSAGITEAEAKKISQRKPEASGSYTSLSDQELAKICPILANEGVNPLCVTDMALSPGNGPKKYNYPSIYVVAKSGQTLPVNLYLKCSITSKKIKYKVGFGHEGVLNQTFIVESTDVEKLESPAITKWQTKGSDIQITVQKLPPNYQSSNPLNIAGKGLIRDVMTSSLNLKMKGLTETFSWLMVVEP